MSSGPAAPPVDPLNALEHAPSGFALLDRDYVVVYENAMACRILGLAREVPRGRVLWDLLPTGRQTRFAPAIERAMRERTSVEYTAKAVRLPRWIRMVAIPSGDGLAIYFDDVTDREEATSALRLREERLQLVFEASGVGMWDVDLLTGNAWASQRLREIYGLPQDVALRAEDLRTPFPDDQLAVVQQAIDRAGDQRWRAVAHTKRDANGAVRWIRFSGRTILGEDGTRLRSTGTARDITDERERDEQLRRNARELARAQRMARIGTWSWDLATGAVRWSAETYHIFEFPPETQPSIDALNALYDEEANRCWREAVERSMRDGQPYEIELQTTLPSGRPLWVWALGETAFDDQGRPIEMFGTVQDITQQRVQELALAESEERFRTLADAAPLGIVLTDATGTPTYVNPQLCALFELSPSTFATRWIERVHADDIDRVLAAADEAFTMRGPVRIEYALDLPSGVRHVRLIGRPVPTLDGSFVGQVATIEDITEEVRLAAERARLQQQDLQAQKLESLGLLAGGIAHDFNNLLVGVLTNASLAQLDIPPNHAAREAVEDIERAAQPAADLTRQLLAYAGKGRIVVESLDVSGIVREMAQLLRSAIGRSVSLRLELPDGLPFVHGDATQVRQIVMNLITNGSDAMVDSGGTLRLSSRYETAPDPAAFDAVFGAPLDGSPRVALEVSDEGHGMTPEVMRRIFDPFFTTKFTGRGLGLSAVVGVLKQHDASIGVCSSPGRGTTFTVLFPPAKDLRRVTPTSVPRLELPAGGTVLVVDDDDGVRHVARSLLQRRGFTVVLASDGREGVARFRAIGTELRAVLLDLTMPVLSGAEALATMRAERPDVPVLLMSGYSEHELQATFTGQVAGFLQKPFRAQDLYSALASFLGTKAEP